MRERRFYGWEDRHREIVSDSHSILFRADGDQKRNGNENSLSNYPKAPLLVHPVPSQCYFEPARQVCDCVCATEDIWDNALLCVSPTKSKAQFQSHGH